MKLKDVLLITNNNKGTEYKYLSSMEDYMAILLRAFEGSETELAHAVQELCQTKENSCIFGYYVKDPRAYGVVEFDEQGKVISLEEKPLVPKSNYAVP